MVHRQRPDSPSPEQFWLCKRELTTKSDLIHMQGRASSLWLLNVNDVKVRLQHPRVKWIALSHGRSGNAFIKTSICSKSQQYELEVAPFLMLHTTFPETHFPGASKSRRKHTTKTTQCVFKYIWCLWMKIRFWNKPHDMGLGLKISSYLHSWDIALIALHTHLRKYWVVPFWMCSGNMQLLVWLPLLLEAR